MLKCRYKRCNREPEPGHRYCIFHLSLEEKRKKPELAEKFKQEFGGLYGEGDWDFTGFIFPDEMDLSAKARYDFQRPYEIEDRYPKYEEKTDPVNFSKAEFGNKVTFKETQFGKYAYFSAAQFSGEVDFSDARFSDYVYFSASQFRGHAYFRSASFSGDAYFSDAQFSEYVDFSDARLSGQTYYRDAQFRREAYFTASQFRGHAYFSAAQFSGEAYFKSAQFSGDTYFDTVRFSAQGRFEGAIFSKLLDFSEVRGHTPVYEGRFSELGKETDQEIELFQPGPPGLIFEKTQFNGPTEFHRVDLSRASFQQVSLSNLSFFHSQISKTKFIGCLWGDGPEKTKLWRRSDKKWYGFRRPRLLFDELLWRKKAALKEVDEDQTKATKVIKDDPIDQVDVTEEPFEDLQASDIEVLALQLKQSLEATRDPIPAGDFHFAAMEMKREQDLEMWQESKKRVKAGEQNEKAWPCRFRAWGFWLYKMISGYGECYGRTLLWLGLWLLGFAGLYWWLGGLCPEQAAKNGWIVWPPPDFACVREVWYAFAFSVQHILPFKLAANYIQPMGANADWIQGLAMLETLWGTTLFAFFALALRRRFKR